MAKINIQNAKISSSANYGLVHGTTTVAEVTSTGISGSLTSTASFGVVNVNGATIQNPDDVLNISTNAATNINVQTTNTNSSTGILFSDTTRSRGMVLYQHGSDTLQFRAGGITVAETTSTMAISGSLTSTGSFGQGLFQGRVGIGTSNPDISATSLDHLVVGHPGVGVASTATNHVGIVLGSGNTHIGRIAFLDTPSAFGGAIDYHHAAGAGGSRGVSSTRRFGAPKAKPSCRPVKSPIRNEALT